MYLSVLLFSGILSLLANADSNADLSVGTTSGVMLGKRSSVLNRGLKLFLGVPYAEPPIGNLRFKHPVALKSETNEKDATMFAPSCNQPPHMSSVMSPLLKPNRAEINEDCLYLNIYVPDNDVSNTKLPVMVWLAGEGFDYADPQQFDGSYLAVEGKVIVVTVNYRLSVFAFLTSLSEDAPGNVGLFDQRLALKWVKENIEKFGGDEENVTLFGRFTGAMSAAIHTFSPLSKEERLFNRVILQSGVAAGDWVFDRNPLNATYALAKATDCSFPDASKVIECLRKLPANLLLSSALSLPIRWRPVYDYNLIYENSVKAAMTSEYEPVDMIIGINNDEGSLCTIALNAMQSPLYQKILQETLSKEDFSELVKMNMLEFFRDQDSLLNKLATYNYLKSGKQLRKSFIEFCGDIFVTSRVQKLADEVSQKAASIYMYEFAHRPSFSIHPDFIRAAHGDDVLYALGLPLQITNLPEDEVKLTKKMVQALTNFVRNGNPNTEKSETEWPKYTSKQRDLMVFTSFGDKVRAVERSSHGDAVVFWNEIIPAAEQRICSLSPIASRLISAKEVSVESKEAKTFFLGTHLTLPTAEYMMVGLLVISVFLLSMCIIVLGFLFKIKKYAFQRLA